MNNNEHILYPLSHPQKRIWYIDKVYQDSSVFNIGGAIRVKGKVDIEFLDEAVNLLIKRNEGLRINIINKDNTAYQILTEYKKSVIPKLHFEKFDDFKDWANKEFQKGISITAKKLYSFGLCSIKDNEFYIFLKIHHIISDGWSLDLVAKQLCEIYDEVSINQIKDKEEISYLGFVENEQKYLISNRYERDKEFWMNTYKELPDNLYNDKSIGIEGNRSVFRLNLDKSLKIKEFAKETNCSLNTFFLSVYMIYTSKISQSQDIVLGTSVYNRMNRQERSMLGMFTSTMPIRYKINVNQDVNSLIKKINTELIRTIKHQRYPYDILIQDLQLNKQENNSLFREYINYYNTNFNYKMNNIDIEIIELYSGCQAYDFQLVIKEWEKDGSLSLAFDYKEKYFDIEDINRMYIQLISIVDQIIENPNVLVKNISIVTDEEKNYLLNEINNTYMDYPKEKIITELFEEQVIKTPNNIALRFESHNLTYRELNEKANQLARMIQGCGISHQEKIGIYSKYSLETVIAILGVIKAGGTYVPIDVMLPKERVKYIIDDSKISLLLTNCKEKIDFEFKGECLDLNDKKNYNYNSCNLRTISKPDEIVYIIYTSGSMGNPKGVMIKHRGLVNYINWAKKKYIKFQDESVALYSSLAFDLTVTSIFTPLISGNRINIYYDYEDEFILYKILRENEVNIIKLTPAHLSLLQDKNYINSSIHTMIVGGENLYCSLSKRIFENFGQKIEIFNEYGPTETVVGCMSYKYNSEVDVEGAVPIGIPADNVRIYILDKNKNILPFEIPGELYIAGDGIAKGYLNNEEKTKNSFVDNPFNKGEKMYKTGDICKITREKKIIYIGRSDNQVKIRGHRIELGEIQKNILDIPGINDAVVVIKDNINGNQQIYAYVIVAIQLNLMDIKNELKKKLPIYMIPSKIIYIDKIPLTFNGKVNTKLLLQNEDRSNNEIIKPKNSKEKIFISALEEILNDKNIGLNENFFELGGDSIKAIQLASKLNNLGLKIKVKDILGQNSLQDTIYYISESNRNIVNQDVVQGYIKNTPISSWFFSEKFKDYSYFNQSIILEVSDNISKGMIQIAFNYLIKYHDILRANYDKKVNMLYYNDKYLESIQEIEFIELANLTDNEQNKFIKKYSEKLKSSLNIEEDILIKSCLFDLGTRHKQLLITAHHLIIDGVSWRIILYDFQKLLEQQLDKKELRLQNKSYSVSEWADKLEGYAKNMPDNIADYWNKILKTQNVICSDFNEENGSLNNCSIIKATLTEEETSFLLKKANEPYSTETNELLIIALVNSISDFNNSTNVTIQLEGHGREELFNHISLARTVGWFTSMYPANFHIDYNMSLSGKIKSLKEQIRQIPNKGIDYGILRYLSKKLTKKEERTVRFNYMGYIGKIGSNNLIKFSKYNTGFDSSTNNHMTCLIEIIAIISENKLNISVIYSNKKFRDKTIEKFINIFVESIRNILSCCKNKNQKIYTPSDFEAADLSQNDIDRLFL